jgi:hypothetical protein
MERLAPAEPLAVALAKRKAPEEPTGDLIHTRRCNKRTPCSCELRYESKKFQQNLFKSARPSQRSGAALRSKGRLVVKNLQQLEISIKSVVAEFLPAVDLATLSMVGC